MSVTIVLLYLLGKRVSLSECADTFSQNFVIRDASALYGSQKKNSMTTNLQKR